ncbi:MICAL-like protein 2 isoform X5 [Salarias fasciatus]|uniref:MICAL-like protein 2 n=1 Tax=Salarias fasciatus TaxID=181472 RepID=A0A672FLR8_SALFA|nr:MICAL-like protein 2 isoform X5 [Salarias fasciatus]
MAAVKALQQWCRIQCDGYRDVSITNMTTSFRDGLAFCALIHKHRPDLINYDSLKKENVYDNNKLAFGVAEQELGIPALLDAEDMVALRVPDRLSILTYVSQYYNYFHGRSPIGGMAGIKRPADGSTDEPSGKKNQPVTSRVFPSSKPARENSPPPSSNITRPAPSPRQTRNSAQNVPAEKSHQVGTLSNKCVSCNQHVHLVQRQLVDGKLYHRHCAKSLTSTLSPLRDLPTNTQTSRFSPLTGSSKPNTNTPAQTSSQLGPSWLRDKPTDSRASSSPSPSRTETSLSLTAKESLSDKPRTTNNVARPFTSPSSPRPASGLSSTVRESPVDKPHSTPGVSSRFTSSGIVSAAKESLTDKSGTSGSSPFNSSSSYQPASVTTTSGGTRPTPAPRTSTIAEKTHQSKLKFFESDNSAKDEEKKTTTSSLDINVGRGGKKEEAKAGQAVTVVVNVGGIGGKVTNESSDKPQHQAKASGAGEKVAAKQDGNQANKTKSSAAAFISQKLAEESANNSKPSFTTVALKNTDKPASQTETPKKPTEGVRGRVKLKVDPSILADLHPPGDPSRTSPSPSGRGEPRARTPERGGTKCAAEKASPADWRSMLKPVSKETKPADAPQSSPQPPPRGAGRSSLVGPSASSQLPGPSISVTPPQPNSFQNGQKDKTANGTKTESKVSKMKPDFIPKDEILKELQQIEDNLNELEKRGVDLEMKLRSSEGEGDDDSLTDELMVEWFNLIRNKQVAMRRESELVYIGRTQELEEEQPTVEQELRRLMEKPEHLKTAWDKRREEQLMAKLVEIVNDRNAIVEGLDEDRIREGEEDEQLDKMMRTFSIKKDKPAKKKSPMSKLFSWGGKKEG